MKKGVFSSHIDRTPLLVSLEQRSYRNLARKLGGSVIEQGGHVCTQRGHRGDSDDSNQSNEQAIFEHGCSALITNKTANNFRNNRLKHVSNPSQEMMN